MPRITPFLVVGALALLTSACATLSEGECKTADWYQIGRQDGADGFTRARLYKHREACAEYGVRPDPEQYFAGRKKGLARYCTPHNGFIVGREGDPYRDVCPAKTEPGFLAEYRQGDAIHEIDEQIDDLERDIDRTERRLDDDDSSHDERHRLRRDLRDLYDELRYRHDELSRLERGHERRRDGFY